MVSFDVLNEFAHEVANAEFQQVEKNTFVDFQRVKAVRRQSTPDGMLFDSMRRSTWDEEDISQALRPSPRLFRAPRVSPAAPRTLIVKTAHKPRSCPGNVEASTVGGPQREQVRFNTPAAPAGFDKLRKLSVSSSSTQPGSISSDRSWSSTPSSAASRRGSLSSLASQPQASPQASPQACEPKKKRRAKKVAKAAADNETTLMLRYLPRHYTPASLLQELQAFLPHIDFFYLPTSFETRQSLGYAFVNFNDKHVAQQFEEFWLASGISKVVPDEDGSVPASPVFVQLSRVQGFHANVDRIRNSSVMKDLPAYLKPIILKNGVPQSFEERSTRRP